MDTVALVKYVQASQNGVMGRLVWILNFLAFCCWLVCAASTLRANEFQPRPWWEFVADIDAQHQDGKLEHGKGIVIGHDSQRLMILTVNHVVRSKAGQEAVTVNVRLAFSAANPRAVQLTGLFNAAEDIALIVVPIKAEENVYGSLVIGCCSALQPGAALGVGDISRLDNLTFGSFGGYDSHGNLIVRNLSVIRGQSGAPLINSEGAVIGIITSSEGSERQLISMPIDRIEALFKDETYFDESLNPMTKAEFHDYCEQTECNIMSEACKRYEDCVHSCDLHTTSGVNRDKCIKHDCDTYNWSCHESKGPRCLPFKDVKLRKPYIELRWNIAPICKCIESRISKIAYKDIRRSDLLCTEPGLFTAVNKELQGDQFGLFARLIKRFPAIQTDLEAAFKEKSSGQLWKYYQYLTQKFGDPDQLRNNILSDLDSEALMEAEGIINVTTRFEGLPVCLRLPQKMMNNGSMGLLNRLGLETPVKFRIEQYKCATTECTIPFRFFGDHMTDDHRDEKGILLLQLGDRWIFFWFCDPSWSQ